MCRRMTVMQEIADIYNVVIVVKHIIGTKIKEIAMDNINEKKINFKEIAINTTTIIGLITVFYYVIAYRFEAGYKSFFLIPDKLIEMNILAIIRPGLPLTMIFLIAVGGLIGYFIISFVIAIIIDKLILKKFISFRLFDFKDIAPSIKLIVLVVLVSVTIPMHSFSYDYGRDFASETKSFWVIEIDDINYAVVDTYNNNFIAVPVNLENGTFKSQFKFITPEDINGGLFENVIKEKALILEEEETQVEN